MVNNRCVSVEVTRYLTLGNQAEPSCPAVNDPSKPYGERHYFIPESAENRRAIKMPKGVCRNSTKGIFSNPDEYILAGKSRPDKFIRHLVKEVNIQNGKPVENAWVEVQKGSQRLQCEACFTKFSIKLDPQQRHYRRDINLPLFLDMMNKGIINRAEEKFGVDAKVIYDKLNFYYEQALAFEEYYKQRLGTAIKEKTLNISTDRQHYLSNWGDHNMPMPTPIMNTSTADNGSGYVFASTVNFDFQSDYKYIHKEFKEKKEFEKESYYSRYAQYVLKNSDVNTQILGSGSDVEMQIPPKGLLVQQTYNILTHFSLIHHMLDSASKINLFADNDAGFKMAICGVFQPWIASKKMNAFQLSVDRAGGHKLLDQSTTDAIKIRISELEVEFPNLSEKERLAMLWKEHFSTRVTKPGARSEWIISPNLKSRFSGILPLIQVEGICVDSIISSIEEASLHGVDNWFQIIRRHLNMLERPVTSGTNSRRWNAYAGYNPEWMTKLIEIKRVYFNYCMTNEKQIRRKTKSEINDKVTTPAMRLGLVDQVFEAKDILSFSYNDKKLNIYR